MLNIVYSLDKKKQEFLSSEYLSYVDKLDKMLLGNSLLSLQEKKGFFKTKEDELVKLQRGRESRNWIVHRSADDLLMQALTHKKPIQFKKNYYEKFKAHVEHISKADYLVSKWSYSFYEKEDSSYIGEDNYVRNFMNWIFIEEEFYIVE
ncbi:MAG: hypothetical protein WD424_09210 [Paenibacillaceae bacterium]